MACRTGGAAKRRDRLLLHQGQDHLGGGNPTSGRTETLTGDAERAEITHRVVCRSASLPELGREMYFIIRGQRLDVSYWLPIYNRRGWVEIYCTLRQGEVTRDGS